MNAIINPTIGEFIEFLSQFEKDRPLRIADGDTSQPENTTFYIDSDGTEEYCYYLCADYGRLLHKKKKSWRTPI